MRVLTKAVKQEFGIEPQERFGAEGYTYVLIAPLPAVHSDPRLTNQRKSNKPVLTSGSHRAGRLLGVGFRCLSD